MREKSRLILLVTIWDILIAWVIGKTLDYFAKRLAKRLRLKGNRHIHLFLLSKLEGVLLWANFFYIIQGDEFYSKVYNKEPLSWSQFVLLTLKSHKQLHKNGIFQAKSCRFCRVITEKKDLLMKYVTNPELYPPFKFSRSS